MIQTKIRKWKLPAFKLPQAEQTQMCLDEHTTYIYPLPSVSSKAEHLPGHSQPPPLALLATAAAYDLASRISNLWGWMANVSTSELLVMEDSDANRNPNYAYLTLFNLARWDSCVLCVDLLFHTSLNSSDWHTCENICVGVHRWCWAESGRVWALTKVCVGQVVAIGVAPIGEMFSGAAVNGARLGDGLH